MIKMKKLFFLLLFVLFVSVSTYAPAMRCQDDEPGFAERANCGCPSYVILSAHYKVLSGYACTCSMQRCYWEVIATY